MEDRIRIADVDDLIKDTVDQSDIKDYSVCDGDDSWFKADYEPETSTDTNEEEDIHKPHELREYTEKEPRTNHLNEKSTSSNSEKYFLSDEENDDIEVIDVISHEQVSSLSQIKENQNQERNEFSFNLETFEKENKRQRSISGTKDKKDKSRLVSSKTSKKIFVDENERHTGFKENYYTRADLEKVKAFFSSNKNKRKETEYDKPPAKKLKGNREREMELSLNNSEKEKVEVEGKSIVKNYIPFPSKESDFERDIKTAFKDELNQDILSTLTSKFCGLCFKDFDDNNAAWRHYTGTGHKGTIRRFNKGTYKGHPPYWRMIHEILCRAPLAEKELLEEVYENYNVGNNKEKVENLVRKSIDWLRYYRQIDQGRSDGLYVVKNKNAKEVGKIFENYFHEKRKSEGQPKPSVKYGVDVSMNTRRTQEEPSTEKRSYDVYSESSRDLGLNSSSSRHYSSHKSSQRDEMLMVDPSKLRRLPNGQIMIKPDDVRSFRT